MFKIQSGNGKFWIEQFSTSHNCYIILRSAGFFRDVESAYRYLVTLEALAA
jgi:hypothetical protein